MTRRLMDYGITEEAFLSLLASLDGRTRFRLHGLPESPRIVGVHHDHERRTFRVRIESPAHAEVREGEVVPWGKWEIERIPHAGLDPNHVWSDEEVLRQVRGRQADAVARGISLPRMADVETLLRAHDNLTAALGDAEAELTSLRAIFENDMLDESAVAREAYAQGWRDCQRQAALTTNAQEPTR